VIRTPARIIRQHLHIVADRDDADLLRRHAAGDPDAFAALVRRHGPLVYGVCRRVLGRAADADDAFQATFLALARRPNAMRHPAALPAWLHRVALRISAKALSRRKPVHPVNDATASGDPGPEDRAAWAEVRRALDEELNRLPDHLRSPLVLCYLDGATRDEAAARLQLSLGTLDRRLAAGRALLRDRLARRGLGAVTLGAAVFADGLNAAVPAELAQATARLAVLGAVVPSSVATLAVGGGLRIFPIAASVALLGGLSVVFIGAAGRPGGDEPARPQPPSPVAGKPPEGAPDDPLPAGAVARMGFTRFRHAGLSDFACLPDNKTVLTLGADRVVRAWDMTTGQLTRSVALQKGVGGALALSADGKFAAACNWETVTVWDTDIGKVLASFAGPKPSVGSFSTTQSVGSFGFSPDGKMLCATTWDVRLTVWDWRTGKQTQVQVPPRGFGMDSTFHGGFSPDGKHFAGGGGSGQPLCLFETATWKEVHRLKCSATTSTFTPDGKRLVVCSMANDAGGREAVIRVFDVATGKELAQYRLGFEGAFFSLAVSPDGKLLGCGASDRSCLLDLSTGKVLHPLTGRPWGLAFTPDGKTFVASADASHLRFWDVATGKERHEQPGNFGHSLLATSASPDGRLLAAADWPDRAVHVWDTSNGRLIRRLSLAGEGRYTRDLAFSPDGTTLSAGLYYGEFHAWEAATGKELRAVELTKSNRQDRSFYSARLSPDGRTATTIDQDTDNKSTRLTVWDLPGKRPKREWTFAGGYYGRLWSPDGDTLVLSTTSDLSIIDIETGEQRARLAGTLRDSSPAVLSPDGRLVAARLDTEKGKPAPIGVFEVATGKPVARVAVGWGHYAIAADNRTFITADNTHLRSWDLATGKETASRTLPQGVTGLVALAGRRAFTPMADGTGLVWDLPKTNDRAAATTTKEVAGWWTDLRSDDSAKAYAAIWRMNDVPADVVVAFLRTYLRPEAAPDPAKLRQLVADLNSDTFRVREKAEKELQELGHAAVPALRKELDEKPGPEMRQRIEQLLSRKPDPGSRPEALRRLRAMQVVERAATKEARALLTELAEGLPLAPETKEARAALGRLGEPPR
jgi:RNA polymerase sigma factor (sigma-70 family)